MKYDQKKCQGCEHWKDIIIDIGIDEHTVKCCESWTCIKDIEKPRRMKNDTIGMDILHCIHDHIQSDPSDIGMEDRKRNGGKGGEKE